jgi:alkylated DNA nucleotide flippase Atl1
LRRLVPEDLGSRRKDRLEEFFYRIQDVAKAAGFPGAARQVVWALPWHRVLGANGRIRLPGEQGLEQRLLLRSEGAKFLGDRVDLKKSGFGFNSKTLPR